MHQTPSAFSFPTYPSQLIGNSHPPYQLSPSYGLSLPIPPHLYELKVIVEGLQPCPTAACLGHLQGSCQRQDGGLGEGHAPGEGRVWLWGILKENGACANGGGGICTSELKCNNVHSEITKLVPRCKELYVSGCIGNQRHVDDVERRGQEQHSCSHPILEWGVTPGSYFPTASPLVRAA